MKSAIKENQKTSSKNLKKGRLSSAQNKPDATRVKTITSGNDNSAQEELDREKSSNVGQGPAVENL